MIKAALIFLITTAALGSVQKQKQGRVEGGVYAFTKQLKNGQDLKIVLNEIIDDGKGNGGFKITFTAGKAKKSAATETPESIASIIKESYGVEFGADLFADIPDLLNDPKAQSHTLIWLKSAADLEKLRDKKKEAQLTFKTGNPDADTQVPKKETLKSLNEESKVIGKLELCDPEHGVAGDYKISDKKSIRYSTSEIIDDNEKKIGWDCDFSISGQDDDETQVTGEHLKQLLESLDVHPVDANSLKKTAQCLNDKSSVKCAFSIRNSVTKEQVRSLPARQPLVIVKDEQGVEQEVMSLPIVEAQHQEVSPKKKEEISKVIKAEPIPILKAEKPREVGRQEFDEAARMRFCIDGLQEKGAFTELAFDGDIHLAHRYVNFWQKYVDSVKPTCFIEFGFERPDFCAFTSRFEKDEVIYTLRGDSSASCSKFLTGKGYEVESEVINPIYQFNHQAGKEDLREDQIEAIEEFLKTCRENKVFPDNLQIKPHQVKSFSVQHGHHQAIALTLKTDNAECSIEQKKKGPFMVSYVLVEGAHESCKSIINEESKQKSIFPKKVGDWQKKIKSAVGPIVGEMNDNGFFAQNTIFASKDIIYVTETVLENGSSFIIGVLKDGLFCSFGMLVDADGKANFSLLSGDDKCSSFTSKASKLI